MPAAKTLPFAGRNLPADYPPKSRIALRLEVLCGNGDGLAHELGLSQAQVDDERAAALYTLRALLRVPGFADELIRLWQGGLLAHARGRVVDASPELCLATI